MWFRWVLVGLVLLGSGCELQLEIEAVFDGDAGGRLAVALAADADLRARAQAAGVNPLDDLAAAGQELASQGWQVADTTNAEGLRTVALSVDFDSAQAFNQLAAEVSQTLAGPEADLLPALTVTVSDERLVVDGTARLQPTEVMAEFGLTPEQAVGLLREEGGFSYVVRVGLPGEVLASTAAAEDDGTLRWTVEPGEQVDIHAVGVRPGRPVWPLVMGALVGLLVAAVAARRFVVVRRRAR